jgi:hypothetical protein
LLLLHDDSESRKTAAEISFSIAGVEKSGGHWLKKDKQD